ncbi:MAG: tetratricopeptide repeat protein, partial [Planctomycetes bacterium]|nr:tetratricopeptide repeat protein [Planctomycetota bacterium]
MLFLSQYHVTSFPTSRPYGRPRFIEIVSRNCPLGLNLLVCSLFVSMTLALSGCASIKDSSSKWAANWSKRLEPKPKDPNNEEIVRYWGQKKKEPKQVEMPAELKERLAQKKDDGQRSRDYADRFREGNQKFKENQLEEARRSYELALSAKPDDPDAHHRLAVIADKLGTFAVADNHYQAALRKRPRDPNLLSDIGYSYSLRGNEPQAERYLQEALTIEPTHKGAMANLGTIFA